MMPSSDVDMGRMPGVSGIVLAGGRSERFGSDKLEAVIDGQTLLGRATAAVAAVADEVVVVAPPGADLLPLLGEATFSATQPVRVVHDPERFAGPFVGLVTGLRFVANPLAVVLAGDMPWVDVGVLRLLIRELAESDVAAATALEAAAGKERLERFPLALRVAPAAAVAARLVETGERRVSALMDALAVRAIPLATWRSLDPDGLSVRDVDRVADLRSSGPAPDTRRRGEHR